MIRRIRRTWELKPDLVAPGNAIVAAGSEGSYLWENYPSQRVYAPGGGTYLTLSGSSMATAVTSGAVAQILQAQPTLTPADVKFALQYTAQRLEGFGLIEQGAGSLNVALAAAAVKSQDLIDAPSTIEIGGETVEAGHTVFGAQFECCLDRLGLQPRKFGVRARPVPHLCKSLLSSPAVVGRKRLSRFHLRCTKVKTGVTLLGPGSAPRRESSPSTARRLPASPGC